MEINTIMHSVQDLIRHYSVMSPTSLRDRALAAYGQQMLNKLDALLNQYLEKPELADKLQAFLTENWALINGTALCYTARPTQDLTLLLCDVAQYVAEIKQLNPIDVLLPGLAVESYRDDYPNLDANINLKALLQTHVLGTGGTCLLPVKLLTELDLSANTIQLSNPYYDVFNPIANPFVDANEYKRLAMHSTLTQAVYDTKQEYETLSSENSNLLGQLTQLCQQLAMNSAGGRGQETNAAGGAYPAIIAFMHYYTNLFPCGFQVMQTEPQVSDLPADRDYAYVLVQPDAEPAHAGRLYFINRHNKESPIKQISLENLKFGLSLMKVNNKDEIPTLTKQNPTLIQIQDTNQYYLYGIKADQTWGLTELDAAVISTLFPKKCAPLRELPLGNVPHAIYDEIAKKNAHTQPFASSMDGLHLSESLSTCSSVQLAAITDMTGHNAFAEKSTLPLALQSEINLLYELARNPTKNINAGENLSTCIASRKTGLIQAMQGHESLLNGISSSKDKRQSLIQDTMHHFESAKSALTQALETGTYLEGTDKLNLNTRLLNALNIQIRIRSLSDLDIIKGLTPDEITSVCAQPGLTQQITTQLGTLENLVIFIMDIPPEKITAFLQANHDELLIRFIRSPLNLAALLISLELDKCKRVVDALKLDIIKSAKSLNQVLQHLTPEQRGIVFDAIKDNLTGIITSAKSLNQVLQHLTPEQRGIVFDAIKDNLTGIITSAQSLCEALQHLTPEQRGIVFDAIKDNLTGIITSNHSLIQVLLFITPEQSKIVMDAIKDNLTGIITSAESLREVLYYVTPGQREIVFDAMKDNLTGIIKSGKSLNQVLQYLTPGQCEIVFDAIKDKLTGIITSAQSLSEVLRYLTPEQSKIVIDAIKDNLTGIITSTQSLSEVLYDLTPEQRGIVFDAIKDNLTGIITSAESLRKVLYYLTPGQREIVFDAIKNNLTDIITSAESLNQVSRYLTPEQHGIVLDAIKNNLTSIITSAQSLNQVLQHLTPEQSKIVMDAIKNNLADIITSAQSLREVLYDLTLEQRGIVFDAMKNKLPDLINLSERVDKEPAYLMQLPEQSNLVMSIIRVMHSINKTTSNENTKAFASALMSDDNIQIKAQFDHLIKNTVNSTELITSLSNIETPWLEKINSALGLQLTTEQLTSRTDIETIMTQYRDQPIDNKKSVTETYKQTVNSITIEHETPEDNSAKTLGTRSRNG